MFKNIIEIGRVPSVSAFVCFGRGHTAASLFSDFLLVTVLLQLGFDEVVTKRVISNCSIFSYCRLIKITFVYIMVKDV